jgi:hypothetical protein
MLAGFYAITAMSKPFRAQNALPRIGTLLSIVTTSATAWVILLARLRRLPLQVVPPSVTTRPNPQSKCWTALPTPQGVFRIGHLNVQRSGCTRQHDENPALS